MPLWSAPSPTPTPPSNEPPGTARTHVAVRPGWRLFAVFIPATGEFVIPDLLGGGNVLMIGRVLYDEFNSNHDWPVAAAVAIALLILLVIPMMLYQHAQSRQINN